MTDKRPFNSVFSPLAQQGRTHWQMLYTPISYTVVCVCARTHTHTHTLGWAGRFFFLPKRLGATRVPASSFLHGSSVLLFCPYRSPFIHWGKKKLSTSKKAIEEGRGRVSFLLLTPTRDLYREEKTLVEGNRKIWTTYDTNNTHENNLLLQVPLPPEFLSLVIVPIAFEDVEQ